jgi:hypothetical protein
MAAAEGSSKSGDQALGIAYAIRTSRSVRAAGRSAFPDEVRARHRRPGDQHQDADPAPGAATSGITRYSDSGHIWAVQ